MQDHASSDLGRRLVVGAIKGNGADGLFGRLLGLAVSHFVLLNRCLPFVQSGFG
jgi:hypothetical protein